MTTATCNDPSIGEAPQGLWDSKVLPFVDLTVKGWLCEAAPTELHSAPEVELLLCAGYQGENDCHGTMGNSALKTGCAQQTSFFPNQELVSPASVAGRRL